jgi:hypothetical protein
MHESDTDAHHPSSDLKFPSNIYRAIVASPFVLKALRHRLEVVDNRTILHSQTYKFQKHCERLAFQIPRLDHMLCEPTIPIQEP